MSVPNVAWARVFGFPAGSQLGDRVTVEPETRIAAGSKVPPGTTIGSRPAPVVLSARRAAASERVDAVSTVRLPRPASDPASVPGLAARVAALVRSAVSRGAGLVVAATRPRLGATPRSSVVSSDAAGPARSSRSASDGADPVSSPSRSPGCASPALPPRRPDAVKAYLRSRKPVLEPTVPFRSAVVILDYVLVTRTSSTFRLASAAPASSCSRSKSRGTIGSTVLTSSFLIPNWYGPVGPLSTLVHAIGGHREVRGAPAVRPDAAAR